MKPIVATLWGRPILIVGISGSVLTYIEEGGSLDFVDLLVDGVRVYVQHPTLEFPLGYRFHAQTEDAEELVR